MAKNDPPRREEFDTLPPPFGADDAYSAETRVTSLPESVLEALRSQTLLDESAVHGPARRAQSGTRRAIRPHDGVRASTDDLAAVHAADGDSTVHEGSTVSNDERFAAEHPAFAPTIIVDVDIEDTPGSVMHAPRMPPASPPFVVPPRLSLTLAPLPSRASRILPVLLVLAFVFACAATAFWMLISR